MLENINFNPPHDLHEFRMWCQKVLPLVYSDEISYYEVLCQIAQRLNEMIDNLKYYEGSLEDIINIQNQINEMINKINKEIDKIKNGDYFGQYVNQLGEWIDNNLQQLVAKTVTYVMFGLTNDGRFCAMIPKTWDFMQFDTVVTPQSPLYGHLILRW